MGSMNWTTYEVKDKDINSLIAYNEPISVPVNVLPANSGIEVFTITGQKINAVYDVHLGGIRQLNMYNPQFKQMPNRDLLLYNDHLLNEKVNTLIVDGFFGTGKTSTLCSHLVSGLLGYLEGKNKDQGGIPFAYISKPHESLGNGYGFLPGDIHDKTELEFQSYYQYFDRYGMYGLSNALMYRHNVDSVTKLKLNIKEPMLEVLVFEYLRGRDIDRGWVVLDETQNTSKKDVSSFLSRTGENTKVVLLGDSTPTQIDKRGNTPENNGLTFAKETYIGTKYTGYVELQTVKHILRGQRVRDLFKALKGA